MPGSDLDAFDISASSRRLCLQGVTITLVEDSLSASEAIRLMSLSSGARLRRADGIATAGRHLAIYKPQVVIVDIGLPDGNGLDLVRELARQPGPDKPGIVALSGADPAEWGIAARRAGAGAMLAKPIESLSAFQRAVLSVLEDAGDRIERVAAEGAAPREPSARVLADDLAAARELLTTAYEARDAEGMRFSGRFLSGVAALARNEDLERTARALSEASDRDAIDVVAPMMLEILSESINPAVDA